EDLRHDGLGAVAEVFKHFADATLEVEAHDDEAPTSALGTLEWRRVAPERPRPRHDRLPVAAIRMTEQPDLVNLAIADSLQHVELVHERHVVDAIGVVERPL